MAEDKRYLVTLGMFIIDEFTYFNEDGTPTGKASSSQIGGGGTYASIGARIWLPPDQVGMIVDRGHDFPPEIQSQLDSYGESMWLYRDDRSRGTTRAENVYRGEVRGFRYLNPRLRITPNDLSGTSFEKPTCLHFICSPSRASAILSEVRPVEGWNPVTIYEPIPDRCIPEELPALIAVLPEISILSPNADEALSLLSIPGTPTCALIEQACQRLLDLGVGPDGSGTVIIRSGHLGAYVKSRTKEGWWVPAYWGEENKAKVVDVTGAGNAFLGGLAAGLYFKKEDVFEAVLYATISAAYTIEQEGLPNLSRTSNGEEYWNGEDPKERLKQLRSRMNI
ncbi:Ribokinase-like protein [Irpex rosettiformis]|uniref:Ribokinase-like protein n=1 Tax=Irpex rosettiformis TaxID=378272 RepID=A0ACB8UF00_9APHY|nr:Ribokinase-like protein [Irpex rosettiformis]